jgi:hypothetical protein
MNSVLRLSWIIPWNISYEYNRPGRVLKTAQLNRVVAECVVEK